MDEKLIEHINKLLEKKDTSLMQLEITELE
jgi:hypothetical protein